MMLYESGEQELCAVSPLPRAHAHELATYLTSRATYLFCRVQTGTVPAHTRFTA